MKRFNKKLVLAFALTISFVFLTNGQDWNGIPVPADAGVGKTWQLQTGISDDFNYTFNATSQNRNFGPEGVSPKWNNFYHNSWEGPGPTKWRRDHVAVNNGFLSIWGDRVPGEFKTYPVNGTTDTKPATRAGCITSTNKVIFPVFVEAEVRIMNSSLASDIWLLSSDDTQEIDIIEAYGGTGDDGRNAFFAERIHLSHHVFDRNPGTIRDYQPQDWNSWWRRNNVSKWGGKTVRIGVYWKNETTIEYYIDGEIQRVLADDAIQTRTLPNGHWSYEYPSGFTNGVLNVIQSGAKAGFQEMNTAPSLKEAQAASNISVIDPYNYLGNGRKITKPLDIIINVEDQSWQAVANRSPNNTEIQRFDDNNLLVNWIRVYKPVGTGSEERTRSITFDNRADVTPAGGAAPQVNAGDILPMDISYATGATAGVEEDLFYIATQIRQIDANGMEVNTSEFVQARFDGDPNAGSFNHDYVIPSHFADGQPIPKTTDLPDGHTHILLLFMSVDGDSNFADANDTIIIESNILSNPDVNEIDNEITLYPNPTQGELNIKGDYKDWKIYSVSGAVIGEGEKSKINTTSFSAGLYFISFDNDASKTIKFVKQ